MKKSKIFLTLLLLVSITSKSQIIDGKSFINSLLIEKDYSKSYSYFDETVKKLGPETLPKEL
jgi:hypothetical protein